MASPNDVIHFWFQELKPADQFAKNLKIDDEIRRRFQSTLEKAARAELFAWRETPTGRLAEIIVLDQFSRNIFREDPRSFAQDPLALALAQEMVLLGLDLKIDPGQRAFVYMPYMHSESLAVHDVAEKLFSQPGLEDNLRFERLHRRILEQFGRYPHRNKVLGRTSTREELEFLQTSNSSF